MAKSNELPGLVDELGQLQARMTDLTTRIDEIKRELRESVVGKIEERFFRCTVSDTGRVITAIRGEPARNPC